MSQHRYVIYQLHHLKNPNKNNVTVNWPDNSQSALILSQNKNLEAVRYSVRKILTLPLNKEVSNNLISIIGFNMGNRAFALIGHVINFLQTQKNSF